MSAEDIAPDQVREWFAAAAEWAIERMQQHPGHEFASVAVGLLVAYPDRTGVPYSFSTDPPELANYVHRVLAEQPVETHRYRTLAPAGESTGAGEGE